MEKKSKKIIVIGAGPAGLAAAYELAKRGYQPTVLEASPFIGGMSRSFDLWGQRVDIGPHRFFSKDKQINAFFNELIEKDFTLVNRLTRIYYRNRFFNYPLKLGNVLKNLPFFTIVRILWDYMIQRIRPIKNPKNFEEWVTNRFGKKLYQIFFKNYTEKLWGIPCTEIDADWAAQRIKTLSLWGAVKSAMFGNRGNKHKTLVDQFAYPENGTGTLYERAATFVTENGGEVRLETPVKRVLTENGKCTGVELTNGEKIHCDEVISTMPLTHLTRGLDACPKEVVDAANSLTFRNTVLVYLECDAENLFEDNWIYVHSGEVKHGRITNFQNWSPSLNKGKKESILCLEYWSFEQEEIWKMDDEALCELAQKEIRVLDLVPNNIEIKNACVVRVPKCYPVYKTGYQEQLKRVENYLDSIQHLTPIGRYGAFKYNNQDHSILMGLLAAQKIADKKAINLWEINTDTEYQEDGKIKDVLVQ